MALGLTLWCAATFIGSFMRNFWLFLAFRAFVGIGEASYSTIAPAIISDLFSSDTRSKVLALFYFAIPFGTGLGYMVGSEVAEWVDDWRYGLRVTPFLGLIGTVSHRLWFHRKLCISLPLFAAVFLIVSFVQDPPRGASDGSRLQTQSSPKEDLIALKKNKSFVLSTVGFTCVTFSAGEKK